MSLALLTLQAATCFVLTKRERIACENDPDRSGGPRFYFAGCEDGNVAFVHRDLPDEIAAAALSLSASQPPWTAGEPCFLNALTKLVGAPASAACAEASIIYRLPGDVAWPEGGSFVCCDTPEGGELVQRFRRDGFPEHLVAAGFATVADLWWPWCMAFEGDRIAAIAFAARLGPLGAELGVHTLARFRGRGHASAATAKWASLPGLGDRALFYSTSSANIPSQRVAEKLGLERIGSGLRII
jgi:hypothetical protein